MRIKPATKDRSTKCPIVLILLLIFTWSALPKHANGEESFVPWEFTMKSKESINPQQENLSWGASFLVQGVKIFQDYISPIDGDRCPMYPTCSAYSIQAIRKHGFFIGFVMTGDRLIHESNETDIVPRVKKGTWRYYDPVSNNDFWWYR